MSKLLSQFVQRVQRAHPSAILRALDTELLERELKGKKDGPYARQLRALKAFLSGGLLPEGLDTKALEQFQVLGDRFLGEGYLDAQTFFSLKGLTHAQQR